MLLKKHLNKKDQIIMKKYQFDDYTLDNISNFRSRKDQIKELKNYEYHHPDNAILGWTNCLSECLTDLAEKCHFQEPVIQYGFASEYNITDNTGNKVDGIVMFIELHNNIYQLNELISCMSYHNLVDNFINANDKQKQQDTLARNLYGMITKKLPGAFTEATKNKVITDNNANSYLSMIQIAIHLEKYNLSVQQWINPIATKTDGHLLKPVYSIAKSFDNYVDQINQVLQKQNKNAYTQIKQLSPIIKSCLIYLFNSGNQNTFVNKYNIQMLKLMSHKL